MGRQYRLGLGEAGQLQAEAGTNVGTAATKEEADKDLLHILNKSNGSCMRQATQDMDDSDWDIGS